MPAERLQKILSNAGVASRRVAEEMILAGRVTVNGEVKKTLGDRADTETDEISVDGVPVLRGRYRYFALHKPRGVITTATDPARQFGKQMLRDHELILFVLPAVKQSPCCTGIARKAGGEDIRVQHDAGHRLAAA